jgi:ribosomal protein S18 acetylase RimI-like enzyme
VFRDADELRAVQAEESWRIRVNDRGDVAVLGVWRDHLRLLAVEALWCPIAAIPGALRAFLALGEELGLEDVVSPPVPFEETAAYESAGMHAHTVVTTFTRHRLAADPHPACPEGLVLREAGHGDLETLLELDTACFEPFWRYDARHIARFFATGRLALAERDGVAVGYTLCTVDGDDGLLGRLCVLPGHRRDGIGTALLHEAVQYVSRNGGSRLTLSTQVDNAPARALYRSADLRDTKRRYAFLRFGADEG